MDTDLSHLPTGTSSWKSLINYALGLGDLSEVDYLELKGSLEFERSAERKRSAAILSRAIIGMANRMPDVAARHLGGFGVVLVGVDQSQVISGVGEVDPADLRVAVQAYVGEDGPRWDHQFIRHPDGLVLAITIAPPQWGDSIHSIRKEYSDQSSKLGFRNGEVFFRDPGTTRPATSHDLVMLQRRLTSSPHTGAELEVFYSGFFEKVDRNKVVNFIQEAVEAKAEELYNTAPDSRAQNPYNFGAINFINSGLPERFRGQVQKWEEECHEKFPEAVDECLRNFLQRGKIVIQNKSDRYLEGVRVRITFPAEVTVFITSGNKYLDRRGNFDLFEILPSPPDEYNETSLYFPQHPSVLPRYLSVPELPPLDFNIEKKGNCYSVEWSVDDLPPHEQVSTSESFVVFSESMKNILLKSSDGDQDAVQLQGSWRVTARRINHVFKGSFSIDHR